MPHLVRHSSYARGVLAVAGGCSLLVHAVAWADERLDAGGGETSSAQRFVGLPLVQAPAEGNVRSDSAAAALEDDVALSSSDVVPAPPAVASTPAAGGAGKADAGAGSAPRGNGLSWSRVPIVWNGALTAIYALSRSGDGSSQRSFGKQASFSGNSFIYAPWLARVNGGFTLAQTDTRDVSRSSSSAYGGNFGVDLFPVSRFPFSAAASRSVAGELAINRYNLAQSYTPRNGDFSTSNQYEHSAFKSPDGASVVQRLTGNYRQTMRTEYPQTLFGTWSFGRSRPSTGLNRSETYELRAEHTANLYDDYGLNLANAASYTRSFTQGDPGVPGSRIGATYAYASTSNSWEPFVDLPLVIQSSLSHSSASLTAPDTSTFIDTTSGQLSTGYSFGNYLSLNVAGRFDHTRTPAGSSTVSAFTVAAQSGYGVGNLTERDLLGFKYRLSYNASAGLSALSTGDVSPVLGGAITQSLSRDFDVGLGMRAPLAFLLAQSYGISWSPGGESPRSVTTDLNLSWQYSQAIYGFSSKFTAKDGRTFQARNPSQFQSITWENQGRLLLSPVSNLAASLNLGWSRQGVRDALSGGELRFGDWAGNGSGSVSYQNARFLNVARLNYSANYGVNFRPGLLDAGGSGGQTYQIFSQSLAYAIGRLRLNATHSASYFGQSLGQNLYFTVTRDLGGVL